MRRDYAIKFLPPHQGYEITLYTRKEFTSRDELIQAPGVFRAVEQSKDERNSGSVEYWLIQLDPLYEHMNEAVQDLTKWLDAKCVKLDNETWDTPDDGPKEE